jgi:hypothetical protein
MPNRLRFRLCRRVIMHPMHRSRFPPRPLELDEHIFNAALRKCLVETSVDFPVAEPTKRRGRRNAIDQS